ncbi:MAG: hypothetical protein K8J31_00285 [Anaerolineae bacterium]|nr:hypothetical protein [Anaerolineae bacterium]
MTIALATAWNPRGELDRFQRLYPLLASVYESLVVTLPPWAEAEVITALDALERVAPVQTTEWPHGRYQSLKSALETGADSIHYADFDRLLRWAETRPDEWRQTVGRVQHSDCLVIGRTAQAWATHPRALRDTESISNAVFSDLLGQDLDLSAGSKGFSKRAVAVLVAHSRIDRPMGADSEWIVLLHRAGFSVEMLRVDGLDWESADRYQSVAANGAVQREAAARYDEDPQHWAMRVGVAAEIVSAGLEALHRDL